MKETLKQRIVREIVSPTMAIGFGTLTVLGAIPYSIASENSADKKAEQTFPHIYSPEQLKEARQAVLIFDSTVHNLISSGESVVGAAKFTDLSRTRQAIGTIAEENERFTQRSELRQNLQKPINKRANNIVYVGGLLFIAGISWLMRGTIRREESNNKMFSESPSA